MLECDYEVKQIDGDYAQLQRLDRPEEELKLVARALLPMEIYEGCILRGVCPQGEALEPLLTI